MKKEIALILAGFIRAMLKDNCGWNKDVIGESAYQLLKAIEDLEERR